MTIVEIGVALRSKRLSVRELTESTLQRVTDSQERLNAFITITDVTFTFAMRTDRVATEAALDGIYVIRTNVAAAKLSAADAVRHYKALSQVERAFRSLKTIDLHVRLWDPSSQLRFAKKTAVPPRPDGAANVWPEEDAA